MDVKIVDLYESCGISKPEHGVGSLRCWIPRLLQAGRTAPAVLILPGGGYGYTSEREAEPIALRFAAQGYRAFVLDYACAPARFPLALGEAAMAMTYLRRHAGELGIRKIAAVGFSAGGHLCGLLGTLFDHQSLLPVPAGESVRPDALVLAYPVTVSHGKTHTESFENLTGGDARLTEKLSLENLVRPDMPRVFLWHTRDDGAVPVFGTLTLAQALEENGVPFALHIFAHGEHGLSTADALVYPANRVPKVSADVTGWIAGAQDFLAEQGFGIEDEEACR